MSLLVEFHWSLTEKNETGMIGAWGMTHPPRKDEIVWIEYGDTVLHVRVSSVRWELTLGGAKQKLRVNVKDLDL